MKKYNLFLGVFGLSVLLAGCCAERLVTLFNANDGCVKRIRDVHGDDTSREIFELAPCVPDRTFSTIQEEYRPYRTVIRVYDFDAKLLRIVRFPESERVFPFPGTIAVRGTNIMFWTCIPRAGDAETPSWLSMRSLEEGSPIRQYGIGDATGFSEPLRDVRFVWLTPTTVVCRVWCEKRDEYKQDRLVLLNTGDRSWRELPYTVRSAFDCSFANGLQQSLDGRFLAVASPPPQNGFVVLDASLQIAGRVTPNDLQHAGVPGEVDHFNKQLVTWDTKWDDDGVLWIWNKKGAYIQYDAPHRRFGPVGHWALDADEEITGFVEGKYIVIKVHNPHWIDDPLYVYDLATRRKVRKLPCLIVRWTYLGNGLMLLEDS